MEVIDSKRIQKKNKLSGVLNHEILYHMVAYAEAINRNNYLPAAIDNITLSIDNELIFNNNYYPCNREELRRTHCITKSVVSLLLGIALEEGWLNDLESSIFDYLPLSKGVTDKEEKKKITVKHLLTNTSGIAGTCPVDELPGNPLEAILNQKKLNDPGIQFDYSNGSAHLIAMILSNCVNRNLALFAEEKLF